MTFEEWLIEQDYLIDLEPPIRNLMRLAWNAAKEVDIPGNQGISDEEYKAIQWYIDELKDDLEMQGFRVNVVD